MPAYIKASSLRICRLNGWFAAVKNILAVAGLAAVVVVSTPLSRVAASLFIMPTQDFMTGDVLIVFGGGEEMSDGALPLDSYLRCVGALQFWETGRFRRVIVSGAGKKKPVSSSLKHFLVKGGIPPKAIQEESRAENTYENALYSSRLLAADEIPVLVTSDYHMRRAQAVFRRLNGRVIPAPVSDAVRRSADWKSRFSVAEDLVLETTKLVYYRLHGYV